MAYGLNGAMTGARMGAPCRVFSCCRWSTFTRFGSSIQRHQRLAVYQRVYCGHSQMTAESTTVSACSELRPGAFASNLAIAVRGITPEAMSPQISYPNATASLLLAGLIPASARTYR